MNNITFQDVYQTTTAAGQFQLGQRAATADGREWQYVKAQSTLANSLVAVPDAVASSDLYSSSTDSQGRIVYLTRAANSLTIGQYENGVGVVDEGTGVGQVFKIRTNNATTFTLYPETALTTALAVADSDLTYISMSYVDPAAVTSKKQMAQGIAQASFAAADYGWVLTNGTGRVIAGEALAVAAGFTTGDDTAGQVKKAVTAEGPFDAQNLGYDIVAGAIDGGHLVMVIIR
jgi:hypothetical protein